ncbi:kinetochore complex Sim4 subunit Fta1-domain-containing protein [Macrophomina phaseolina]|uniref:Kinetochore complex Sim4 subunit Fta1-domain-containing protein n=1 Tax=Macrophomina phaseolina TaxID=35725 RepID=A0ABQ8G0S1_9PEZI|nr:kinetochore complex Sim4 subunit Fta1-domain-containing protein [Macrophomina phaseolina]
MTDPIPKYPLYDATFTAYRLSPLYHGPNPLLEEPTLRMHARRLRDILRGDILRGVDIGGGNTDGSTSGTLERCTWDLIGDEVSWQRLHQPGAEEQEAEQPGELTDAPSLAPSEARGIHVELRYQKATYTALLLRDPENPSATPPDFTSLPLLLVRMPAALRATFNTYLTTAFDTRLALLRLPSRFLCTTLESILCHTPTADLLTRLQLQLSFPTACSAATLRNIDITLAPGDIASFVERGAALLPSVRTKNGSSSNNNNNNNDKNNIAGPFTAALAAYLDTHLALDFAHEGVRAAKVVVPPLLALSADGKVKIFPPPQTAETADGPGGAWSVEEVKGLVEGIYAALVRAARGVPVGEEAVLAVREEQGKGSRREKELAAQGKGKGKKRALGKGDKNADGGGKKKRPAPPSPAEKRWAGRRRDVEGENEDAEDEGADVDADGESGDEEEVVAGSAAAGAGRLSVPQEPPPPYELHDPAIVGRGR